MVVAKLDLPQSARLEFRSGARTSGLSRTGDALILNTV